MATEDLPGEGQTHARALGLGDEEGAEEVALVRGRNTRAGVRHRELRLAD